MGVLDRSTDGYWLAVGSGDGAVKLVRLSDLMRPNVFWHEEHVRAVVALPGSRRRPLTALSVQPGGKLIAADGGLPTVSLWDRESLKLVDQIEVPEPGVMALTFSPSGRSLAVAVRAGPVLIYEQNAWRQPRARIDAGESDVSALAYSPVESALIVAYENGQIRFFDAATATFQSHSIQLIAIPLALCPCEQGRLLAIGTDAGEIHLWDPASNQMRHVIKGHSGRVATLAVLPDGTRLVSAGRDYDLKLWDTATGEPITTLAGHMRQVFSVAVSPDGSTLASGGLEGDVRLWRATAAR
jgi:WD40 repeat protein